MNQRKKSDLKKEYTRLIRLVKDIIDQWDPIGLFPHCPPDEYDMEIESVAAYVNKDFDTDTLAVKIQEVFQKSFGTDIDFNECLKIAETLKHKLEEEVHT